MLLERTFQHVAESKKLGFKIHLKRDLPETIATDPQRLHQILNNLLSNAFKFTERGTVEFIAGRARSGWEPHNSILNSADAVISLSVRDTGIGIQPEKQALIFEAFAQGDGTISRKYGGTGLGLSICRELTRLLGGEITLESELGMGSTFTVYLPVSSSVIAKRAIPAVEPHPRLTITDTPWLTEPGSRDGDSKREERILVVSDNLTQAQHILDLLGPIAVQAITAASSEEALLTLQENAVGCLVVDLREPGSSGWQTIDKLGGNREPGLPPILFYTEIDLTPKQEAKLIRLAKSTVVKEVRSADRLRDEIAGIFHQARSKGAVGVAAPVHGAKAVLAGKKALIVDDDVRNIFALTAMLERQEMEVIAVDSGMEAIETLARTADVDIAVVDIMMPEMDGYVTMTKMRALQSFKDRPIIALTAKAMSGDREKCIAAGASDYVAKPVNTAHLISVIASWLSKEGIEV
jgi:two-component system chemotaxis sensor kinase CheA